MGFSLSRPAPAPVEAMHRSARAVTARRNRDNASASSHGFVSSRVDRPATAYDRLDGGREMGVERKRATGVEPATFSLEG